MSSVFPGFLGNERVAQALSTAVDNNSLTHTLLLVGAAGTGKSTLAGKVAQKLFCPELCGRCRSCQMFQGGVHPDYLFITAEGKDLRLEHAQQVKEFLASAANTAGLKVAVIENCHNLTVEAGNSLLKVLEEPSIPSVTILTADNPDNVLSTLVSRSLVYRLAPLPPSVVSEVLADRGVASKQAQFLALFCQGVLGVALEMLEDENFWSLRGNFAQQISDIINRRENPLQASESWHQMPERFLDLTMFWLRDLLFLDSPDYQLVNGDQISYLKSCSANCPRDKIIQLMEDVVLARRRLKARANPRLVFDSLLLKMWEV